MPFHPVGEGFFGKRQMPQYLLGATGYPLRKVMISHNVNNNDNHKKSVFSRCKYIYFMLKPAEYKKLTYPHKYPIILFIQTPFISVQHS